MSAHDPIGSCCSRPRFNSIDGIDDHAWNWKLNNNRLFNGVRKVNRTTALAVAGILAVLAVMCAYALLRLAD